MSGVIPFLGRLFGGAPGGIVPLSVEGPLWAVGDVHGCLGLYLELEAEIVRQTQAPLTIVVLGDMVDRGPDTSGVLAHLLAPPPEGVTRHAILGNHEDMALRFLARPGENAGWITWGGREMLASYGVQITKGATPKMLASRLAESMPREHRDFLRRLPLGYATNRFVFTHAGAGPELPLSRQGKTDLTWARHAETDDLIPPSDLGDRIVVHGHVPIEEPRHSGWRINIDTGAYSTGRLSAVRLDGDRPRFLTVGGAS